ncbi:MAG: HlyD family efflux transporter periplasmic adaptor subunit [bacterium]|nr:HlyD family efflux transporter periplasmic adaptor subunit [bacterium]
MSVAAKRSLPLLGAVLVASLTLHAQSSSELKPSDDGIVRRAEFRSSLILTGELQAIEADKIMVPRTPSWQVPIRWMEEDGAVVTKGQTVVELENTQFTSELEQKQLEQARATNELHRKEADIQVNLADLRFQREQARTKHAKAKLDADVPPDLLPQRDYQEMQLELARAEVELEKAQENFTAAETAAEAELEELRIRLARSREQIRTAEEAIERLSLKAPRDGILVVTEKWGSGRKLQIGDNAFVGMAVATIPELSAMKVVGQLSDVDDGKIEVGMRAVCTLDTYPDLESSGVVTEISPIAKELDERSLRRAFNIEVVLDQADPELMRPGMSVRVEVSGNPLRDALVVPRTALDLNGETPILRLENGSEVEVTLGPCNPYECVIEEGATENARLETKR